MLDTIIAMTLACLALLGWTVGMFRKRAQFWVIFCGPIGVAMMLWYFFVALSVSRPALVGEGLEVGWPTLGAMIGGVWALLAKPKPEHPEQHHEGDGGAQSA